MQKYECGNCSKVFSEKERICENWRIEEKSLICPSCRHYLKKEEDETALNKTGNWFLFGLIFFAVLYFIFYIILEYEKARSVILIIGSIVCVPLMLAYRWFMAKSLMGNIKTSSIGKSNM